MGAGARLEMYEMMNRHSGVSLIGNLVADAGGSGILVVLGIHGSIVPREGVLAIIIIKVKVRACHGKISRGIVRSRSHKRLLLLNASCRDPNYQ